MPEAKLFFWDQYGRAKKNNIFCGEKKHAGEHGFFEVKKFCFFLCLGPPQNRLAHVGIRLLGVSQLTYTTESLFSSSPLAGALDKETRLFFHAEWQEKLPVEVFRTRKSEICVGKVFLPPRGAEAEAGAGSWVERKPRGSPWTPSRWGNLSFRISFEEQKAENTTQIRWIAGRLCRET